VITEIVTFQLPEGISRDQLLAKYRSTADKWRQNPDLVHKQYFYNADKNTGGGVYLWKSMEAAQRWHGSTFRQMVMEIYGSEPSMQYLEGMLVVDNLSGQVYDNPPA
jgi:hypothetical protein